MKKYIKRISLLLAGILTLGMLSACKDGSASEDGASSEQVQAVSKVSNEYRVELANFEQWKPDFSLIRIMENFGKVSRNKDEKYVKSGSYSAKLQPTGGIYAYRKPQMYIPFFSEYYNFNYEDFTYADYIDLWIYNANDRDMPVNVGLVSAITSEEAITTFPAETFYLKANSWNLVTYYVDFNAMSINQSISLSQIMQIKGLYLEFESSNTVDVNDAPVYYVDDVNLYYKDEPNTLKDVSEILEFTHEEGSDVYEICDFEHVYQKYVFSTYVKNAACIPTLTIVNAENEGMDGFLATSGSSVLKIEIPAGQTKGGSWTELILSSKIMSAFYNEFVFDSAKQKPIVPAAELKNYYIAYDIYCVGEVENDYKFAHYLYDSQNNTYARTEGAPNLMIKPDQWQTWSWSLYDVASLEYTRNSILDPTDPTKYNKGVAEAYQEYKKSYDKYAADPLTAGYGDRITDAGQFRILYSEHVGEDRVVYIDNIRVYKA
ncbi:MAG: hypothetical protein IJ514_02655 [Clostridia bacterium]|nr:hypothetical protein [Clostridia bacterium]